MLLWPLPSGCTDGSQLIDAGYGLLFKMHVGKALDKWLMDADHVELWESNKLTTSQRRSLTTQWAGEAAKKIDVETGVDYRRRLFEKSGLAITADGSDDNLINLEDMEGDISFLDAESTPEPFEDVLTASPAPADKEHPPDSSDEDDGSDEEEGGSRSGQNDEFTSLDVDDDLAEGENPLPPRNPRGVRPGRLSTYRTHRGAREAADIAAVGYRVAQGD